MSVRHAFICTAVFRASGDQIRTEFFSNGLIRLRSRATPSLTSVKPF